MTSKNTAKTELARITSKINNLKKKYPANIRQGSQLSQQENSNPDKSHISSQANYQDQKWLYSAKNQFERVSFSNITQNCNRSTVLSQQNYTNRQNSQRKENMNPHIEKGTAQVLKKEILSSLDFQNFQNPKRSNTSKLIKRQNKSTLLSSQIQQFWGESLSKQIKNSYQEQQNFEKLQNKQQQSKMTSISKLTDFQYLLKSLSSQFIEYKLDSQSRFNKIEANINEVNNHIQKIEEKEHQKQELISFQQQFIDNINAQVIKQNQQLFKIRDQIIFFEQFLSQQKDGGIKKQIELMSNKIKESETKLISYGIILQNLEDNIKEQLKQTSTKYMCMNEKHVKQLEKLSEQLNMLISVDQGKYLTQKQFSLNTFNQGISLENESLKILNKICDINNSSPISLMSSQLNTQDMENQNEQIQQKKQRMVLIESNSSIIKNMEQTDESQYRILDQLFKNSLTFNAMSQY